MGILDKAIEKLQHDSGDIEARDQLLDFLKEAYLNEKVTLEQLKRESKFNPYEHLRAELESIVQSEEKHIQEIKKWIEELNGKLPEVEISTNEVNAYSSLGDIVKRKLEIYDDYAEILNILDNNHLEEDFQRLKAIKEQEKSHIDRLDDIMTKVNS
jgi:rubrerythrin